jgi:hypothetical protein
MEPEERYFTLFPTPYSLFPNFRLFRVSLLFLNEFDLEHGVRMRGEAVAKFAPIRIDRARGRLHFRDTEIILCLDVRTIHLRDFD